MEFMPTLFIEYQHFFNHLSTHLTSTPLMLNSNLDGLSTLIISQTTDNGRVDK